MNSFLQKALIAVVIIAIVIGGYFAFRQQPGSAVTPSSDQTAAATSTASSSAAAPSSLERTISDSVAGFSLSYEDPLSFDNPYSANPTAWRYNTTTKGNVYAYGVIPQSYEPNTNFQGADFTVGSSSDPMAISECLTANNGETKENSVSLNGQIFQSFKFTDAAAGNVYDTTSYRIEHDNQCFAIEYTVHSTDIGNYPSGANIKTFNEASIDSIMSQAAHTFLFTK